MSGWVDTDGAALLRDSAADWAARLAARQARQLREVTPEQIASWEAFVGLLQEALRRMSRRSASPADRLGDALPPVYSQ